MKKKKDTWGSTQYKQANIYSAKIKNGLKGALRPRGRTGQLNLHFHTLCAIPDANDRFTDHQNLIKSLNQYLQILSSWN